MYRAHIEVNLSEFSHEPPDHILNEFIGALQARGGIKISGLTHYPMFHCECLLPIDSVSEIKGIRGVKEVAVESPELDVD